MNKKKIWVRVGMAIEVDADKITEHGEECDAELVRAIRDGELNGETYLPDLDFYDNADVLALPTRGEFELDGFIDPEKTKGFLDADCS